LREGYGFEKNIPLRNTTGNLNTRSQGSYILKSGGPGPKKDSPRKEAVRDGVKTEKIGAGSWVTGPVGQGRERRSQEIFPPEKGL